MKSIELNAGLRDSVGKKNSKLLRKQEKVPCVIYGKGEPMHLVVDEKELGHLVYTPDVYLVNLKIGDQTRLALLQDIQFHPVSDHILHADFLEIDDQSPIKIQVPVQLEGFAIGVQSGGKLKLESRRLTVFGLIKDLPDHLKVDVSALELGQSIKVKELDFENLELIDPKNTVVASVKLTRVAKGMSLEAETEAEGEISEEAETVEGEATEEKPAEE